MRKALLTNQKLLEVLGLTGLSIVSLDIACRANQLPQVTAIIHPRSSLQHTQVQQFQLIAIDGTAQTPVPGKPTTEEKPPFDLDAMCWNATQRVKEHINRVARDHLDKISREFMHLRDPGRISPLYFTGGIAPMSTIHGRQGMGQ